MTDTNSNGTQDAAYRGAQGKEKNMQEQRGTDQLAMLIDGESLYRALGRLLGRRPSSADNADMEKLVRYAERRREGGYVLTASYVARRQTSTGAQRFYNRLEQLGYELHLAEQNTEGEIVAELERLCETDRDVLYIGCDSYAGEVTAALRNLHLRLNGSRRNVTVVHFDRRTDFTDEGLDTLDIVVDVGAVPSYVYREADEHDRYPAGYLDANRGFQPDEPAEETALGSALQAALEAKPELATTPIDGAEARDDVDQPPADEPRDLLVLIDFENIDGCLLEFIHPAPLNRQTRPNWEALRQFAEEQAHGGRIVIKGFLQDNGKVRGFADYLRSIRVDAVVLYPEPNVDDPARRRSVVDEAIDKDLAAAQKLNCDLMVVSHDGDFYDALEAAYNADPSRRIAMIGFIENMSHRYQAQWIERFDLERDVHAFSVPLRNRAKPVTVAAIDDYDPTASLSDVDLFGPIDAVRIEQMPKRPEPLAVAIAVVASQKRS